MIPKSVWEQRTKHYACNCLSGVIVKTSVLYAHAQYPIFHFIHTHKKKKPVSTFTDQESLQLIKAKMTKEGWPRPITHTH